MNYLENLITLHALQFAVDNQIIPLTAMQTTKVEELMCAGHNVAGHWVRKALEYALLADERDMSAEVKSFIREMMLTHNL